MEELIAKAATLIEALPYLQKFRGKVFLFKYGGSAMLDEDLRRGFVRDLVLLKHVGIHPVIVHGGGPQIEETLKKMGIKSTFSHGLRVTDDETMKVVEMVLVGQVNSGIVNLFTVLGGNAVGLSGTDNCMIRANKIAELGNVGEISDVNPHMVRKMILEDNVVPVISPIGISPEGKSLNINADVAAAEMAKALKAEKLIMLTDVRGVKDEKGEIVAEIDHKRVRTLLKNRVIAGGMIPKVESALKAIDGGVSSVAIIDGSIQHAVLLEIFTDKGVGTMIY